MSGKGYCNPKKKWIGKEKIRENKINDIVCGRACCKGRLFNSLMFALFKIKIR
jgi:hypothetical protein